MGGVRILVEINLVT